LRLADVITDSDAILLDFDGVLADSEPFFRLSWNRALEPWGHVIGERDYWKYWSSLGEGLEGEIRRCGLDTIDRKLARKRQKEAYLEFVQRGDIPLFDGAKTLLRLLESGDAWGGRPFCIASNTPASIVQRILSCSDAHIPLIVGGEGLDKKPSPAIFLKAADRLGVEPDSTLVLEDSWKGIKAAERGGFTSILVLNRYNGDLDIGGDMTVDGVSAVIKLLESDGYVRGNFQ
jgi:beta-phosphoglucomutase